MLDPKDCKCGNCVPPEEVHYSREYCHVVRELNEKYPGWLARRDAELRRLHEWAQLNPLVNGKTVRHELVPLRREHAL